MKKIICLLSLLIVLSVMTGCNTEAITETPTASLPVVEIPAESSSGKEDIPTSEPTSPFLVRKWKNYSGDIPTTSTETILPITTNEDNMVHIFDTCYREEKIPENKLELPMSSGWRIDLNSMEIVGKTTGGEIIMATDSQEPLLVCIANSISEKVSIFLNTDIADKGIESFDFSSFDVYYGDQLIKKQDKEIVERMWLDHIHDNADVKDSVVLDGDWEYYSLTLVHKECSALRYELNLGICGDKLYMENIHRNYYIRMSLDQL